MRKSKWKLEKLISLTLYLKMTLLTSAVAM
ncbi:hypothetical protein [Shigella phage ESh32]|nr:hypothetical protein [Shigella phage ESh25]URY15285.1 hypothetical protein [Shigella phage ESh32]URY15692.1 hypothetical protein [Shigella phage ESH35]